MGIPEGKERKKETEAKYQAIMTENFSKLLSDTIPQMQGAQRPSSKTNAKTKQTNQKNKSKLHVGL